MIHENNRINRTARALALALAMGLIWQSAAVAGEQRGVRRKLAQSQSSAGKGRAPKQTRTPDDMVELLSQFTGMASKLKQQVRNRSAWAESKRRGDDAGHRTDPKPPRASRGRRRTPDEVVALLSQFTGMASKLEAQARSGSDRRERLEGDLRPLEQSMAAGRARRQHLTSDAAVEVRTYRDAVASKLQLGSGIRNDWLTGIKGGGTQRWNRQTRGRDSWAAVTKPGSPSHGGRNASTKGGL